MKIEDCRHIEAGPFVKVVLASKLQRRIEMKTNFVLLIYHGPNPTLPGTDRWNALPATEQKAIYADYAQINKEMGNTAGLPLGLADAARTVQVQDGKTVVKNGTYLPEGVGGYLVFEAESMQDAIKLASRIPAARHGGAVEIRPGEKYF